MSRREHWEDVYARKSPETVSWYQPRPGLSLELIRAAGVSRADPLVDVGGGASTLVDHLLEEGYTSISVLDVSDAALRRARDRLGPQAARVEWICEDVTRFKPPRRYALWHDRAVFHFLVDAADRRAYVEALQRSLLPGATVIIATFAPEGPEKCSGLPVMRHDEESLQRELGTAFPLQCARRELHVTPAQAGQAFLYAVFRYTGDAIPQAASRGGAE